MNIYRIVNKINGKQYVGQTHFDINIRYKKHISDIRYRKSAICLAIKKYGQENFYIELLDTASSQEELNDKEIYYINFYNCVAPNGYNLTLGGEGGKKSEEFKKQSSLSRLGKKHGPRSEQARLNLKKGAKNRKEYTLEEKKKRKELLQKLRESNPNKFGHFQKHTKEAKQKISENTKNKPKLKLRKKIKLINIETNEIFIFDSITEASIKLNINRRSISNVLHGWAKKLENYYVERMET